MEWMLDGILSSSPPGGKDGTLRVAGLSRISMGFPLGNE